MNGTCAVTINSSGSVGIGLINPQTGFLLDVNEQSVTIGSAFLNESIIELGASAYKLTQSAVC